MTETMITLGARVREARERLGWTQSQLADKIGVTPSYITKLEKDESLPSYDRTLALANILVMNADDLLTLIESHKEHRSVQRIRTRGTSMRNTYGQRAQGDPDSHDAQESPSNTAAQLGREILESPDLQVAFTYLRAAIADPELRSAVLKTLEAFAKQAKVGG